MWAGVRVRMASGSPPWDQERGWPRPYRAALTARHSRQDGFWEETTISAWMVPFSSATGAPASVEIATW